MKEGRDEEKSRTQEFPGSELNSLNQGSRQKGISWFEIQNLQKPAHCLESSYPCIP